MARKQHAPDDAVLARAAQVIAASATSPGDLGDEYRLLTGSYRTLLRKLHKTLVISDSYQDQLMRLNDTLTQKVEEETERRLAQERLLAQQAKMAAMGEMIAAIAHQWRQPLTTVNMLVQNIREAHRHEKLDAAYLDRATGKALSQIQFMSETIATFRDFFKPEKTTELFSVSARVAEAASLLRSQIAPGDMTLEVAAHAGDDMVRGLPNEFAQVMVNLLANARDAIQERRAIDGASAADTADRDRIAILVLPEPERVTVEVRDNGVGIPVEAAGQLFNPDFSTKKNREGSGLGLYMSRLIIEQSMGGTISFSSMPGATVFRLVLPRQQTKDAAVPPTVSPA